MIMNQQEYSKDFLLEANVIKNILEENLVKKEKLEEEKLIKERKIVKEEKLEEENNLYM